MICTGYDEIVVGGCASGRYKDCANSVAHSITCCKSGLTIRQVFIFWKSVNLIGWERNLKPHTSNCRWQYANYGDTVRCDAGEVVQGQCSSGAYDDCGRNKFSGIYCCKAR